MCVCAVLLKVYCSDHTYTTIRIAVAATGGELINAVADKLGTSDELLLVHLSSAGGKKPDLNSEVFSLFFYFFMLATQCPLVVNTNREKRLIENEHMNTIPRLYHVHSMWQEQEVLLPK